MTLGKTNTSEFGLLPTAEPELFGPARNPWNTGHMTGGSSGGSAAAVAAGLVPVAHANDGGGSIRIPASCCGLFGLKPTRGRNSLAPHYGDIGNGIVHEHVVSRSVRDSAAILDATTGAAPGDPYAPPPPDRPFVQEVGADPDALRIAVMTGSMNGCAVHRDCVAAVGDAARLCEALGHRVDYAEPDIDWDAIARLFSNLWTGMFGWAVADWSRRLGREPAPDRFEPWTWRMYEVSQQVGAADYLLAVQDAQRIARIVGRFFRRLGYPAHADRRRAAPAGRQLRLDGGNPPVRPAGRRAIQLAHAAVQRDRPAGDECAAGLERRGIAGRRAVRRALRRRGNPVSPGGTAGNCPALEGSLAGTRRLTDYRRPNSRSRSSSFSST